MWRGRGVAGAREGVKFSCPSWGVRQRVSRENYTCKADMQVNHFPGDSPRDSPAERQSGGLNTSLLFCFISGERGRNRTFNLLIKSQLLCQLSYAPMYRVDLTFIA